MYFHILELYCHILAIKNMSLFATGSTTKITFPLLGKSSDQADRLFLHILENERSE